MDWSGVRFGITRDLVAMLEGGVIGWVVFLVVFGLPVGSAWAVGRGSWLAVLPLAVSAGLGAIWVLYYGTDWWSNPGLAGAALPVLVAAVAWVPLLVALRRLPE